MVVLACVSLVSSVAFAGGLWNLDRGVSNYARGAANIAAPRDPIGIYTNPAALSGLRGLQLMVDANAVYDNKTYTRAADEYAPSRGYPTVSNTNPTFPPSPGFFFTYNLKSVGLEQMTIGAGGWGPPRADATWDKNGPQRYQTFESHNLQVHYGASVSYALPWYGLKVGVTGMLIDQVVKTGLKLSALPVLADGGDDFDVGVVLDATDAKIPAAIFGLSAQPVPFLIVGASFQTPWNVRAKGKADVELSEELVDLNTTITGENVEVRLKMPFIARLAVQYVDPINDLYDIEIAGVYEGWSRNEAINLYPDNIVFTSPLLPEPETLSALTIKSNYKDAFSVRLGGRYNALPGLLTVRAGAYFETAAVPQEYLTAGAFDSNRIGLTAGGRIDMPYGLWADFAGGYVMWMKADVKNSKILLSDPLTGEQLYPTANGVYENQQIFMMAALGAAVDI